MLPVEPTPNLMRKYSTMAPVKMHSPNGAPEDECGSLVVLAGKVVGGTWDGGPLLRTFWKPSEDEIEALKNGAVIELDFYDNGMPMTAMNVEVDV